MDKNKRNRIQLRNKEKDLTNFQTKNWPNIITIDLQHSQKQGTVSREFHEDLRDIVKFREIIFALSWAKEKFFLLNKKGSKILFHCPFKFLCFIFHDIQKISNKN